jgi:hypothetical protein
MRAIFILIGLLCTTVIYTQRPDYFEIKPAMGITGLLIKPTFSVIVTYPVTYRWSVSSYSMLSLLPAAQQQEQYITTNYNYSLIQNFGLGYSLYGKKGKSQHTLGLMAGIKRVAFSETLANPQLDELTTTVRTTLPEYGLLYNLSLGKKRCRFEGRLYLPLHPLQYYPMGTLDNIAYLELGVGIKLKK